MITFCVICILVFGLTLFSQTRVLWYVLAGTILLASTAQGQELGGEDVIVAVKKGQLAPFDGQLFDNPTALRWGIWLQQMQARKEAELDTQRKTCDAKLAFKDTELFLRKEESDKLLGDLTERLKTSETQRLQLRLELDHPPWYESKLFYFALGAITVGGFTVLAAQTF